MDHTIETLLDAALPHVAFDGFSEAAFRAALADTDCPEALGRALAPRGGVDLAAAYHRRGDRQIADAAAAVKAAESRYSEKVARLIRLRLDLVDPEIVRRGMAVFSLPHHAPEGVRLVFGTADAIWTALGDTSDDVNWWTKRMILGSVFSASVLYWLGDTSDGKSATDRFIASRIDDVMRFERLKARVKSNALAARVLESQFNPLNYIRKPGMRGATPPV